MAFYKMSQQTGRKEQFEDCKHGMNCRNRLKGRCKLRHPDEANFGAQQQRDGPRNAVGSGNKRQEYREGPKPDAPSRQKQASTGEKDKERVRECKFGADCQDFKRGRCQYGHPNQPPRPVIQKVSTQGVDALFQEELANLAKQPINVAEIGEYTSLFARIEPKRADLNTLTSIATILEKTFKLPPNLSKAFLFDLNSMEFLYDIDFLEHVRTAIGNKAPEKAHLHATSFMEALLRFYETVLPMDIHIAKKIKVNTLGEFWLGFANIVLDKKLGLAISEEERTAKKALLSFSERIQGLKSRIETSLLELDACYRPVKSPPKPPKRPDQKVDDPIEPEGYQRSHVSFRDMSLFFTLKEVMADNSTLRKLRLFSPYPSVEEYLDIHFRLFIEDFYSSVKKGIKDYCMNIEKKHKTTRIEGLKMFDGILTEQVATRDGVGFKLRVPIRNPAVIQSEHFKFGTMVLLTFDNFRTFILCIAKQVYDKRITKDHKLVTLDPDKMFFEVLLDPKPERGSPSMAMRLFSQRSLKVGVTANYFESYFHCLRRMQDMEAVPLGHLIVQGRINENHQPGYLCTVAPDLYGRMVKGIKREVETQIDLILKKESMDDTQRAAIVHAFDKQLAIIQGPPGCGKTYVSVLIARTLLNLRSLLGGPIFIICYTNHALDQFLEHIMHFTTRIVRLGGRCKNENLMQFTLSNLRAAGTLLASKEAGYYNLQKLYLEREFNQVSEQLAEAQAFRILTTMPPVRCYENSFVQIEREYKKELNYWLDGLKKSEVENFMHFFNNRTFPLNSFALAVLFWLGMLDFQQLVDEFDESVFQKNKKQEAKNRKIHPTNGPQKPKNQSPNNKKQEELREVEDPSEYEDSEREKIVDEDEVEEIEYVDETNNELEHEEKDYFREEKKSRYFLDSSPTALLSEGYKTCEEMIQKEKARFLQTNPNYNKNVFNRVLESGPLDYGPNNLTSLSWVDRWAINNYFVDDMISKCQRQLATLAPEIETWNKKYREAEDIAVAETLKRCDIVGMTTTGAAKFVGIISKIKSRVTLIEEAAEVLECQIVTSLTTSLSHLILVGDHQQLRPKVNDMVIGEKYRLEISLFERLVGLGSSCVQLSYQRRMRPEISEIIKLFYPVLHDDPSVQGRPNIRGVTRNVFFFSHRWKEDINQDDTTSKLNMNEAKMVVRFADFLLKNGYVDTDITILSLYLGQRKFLKECLKGNHIGLKGGHSGLGRIRVTTVDDFQGEECKIILLSLVRSNTSGTIGFLKLNNRINVAFSRAREGLFVFGDATCIREYYERTKDRAPDLLLYKVVCHMSDKGFLDDKLELVCSTHGNKTIVKSHFDFDQCPAGGCKEPCQSRLGCGHSCKKLCHNFQVTPDNPDGHKGELCLEVCVRNHGCAHPCRQICSRCVPETFRCKIQIKIEFPKCGHSKKILCGDKDLPTNRVCNDRCDLDLRCGHRCSKKCHEPCWTITEEQEIKQFYSPCTFPIDTLLPCGHTAKRPCGQDIEFFRRSTVCRATCEVLLDCKHNCSGICSECRFEVGGEIHFYHADCTKKCDRPLPCGHECLDVCTDSNGCSPCAHKCFVRCSHSYCPMKCGEVCQNCVEDCQYECEHQKCTLKCHQICNKEPCNEPCKKMLDCGHPCVGLCGEECPPVCRICNRDDETFEIFFGNEDEPDARFIKLDCKHSFVATDLDRFFEGQSSSDKEVQYPRCPKCKSLVRFCMRYQKLIKQTTKKLNLIKAKVLETIDIAHQTGLRTELTATAKKAFFEHEWLKKLPERFKKLTDTLPKTIRHIKSIFRVFELGERLAKVAEALPKSRNDQFAEIMIIVLLPKMMNPVISEDHKEAIVVVINGLGLFAELQKLIAMMQDNILTSFRAEREVVIRMEEETRIFLAKTNGFFCGKFLVDLETFVAKQRKIFKVKKIDGPDTYKEINHILGLGSGHWHVCPNGHPFVIADCGGAMMESKCPDCKSTIGGSNHTLATGNRAVNLDGAGPAWDPGNHERDLAVARNLQNNLG